MEMFASDLVKFCTRFAIHRNIYITDEQGEYDYPCKCGKYISYVIIWYIDTFGVLSLSCKIPDHWTLTAVDSWATPSVCWVTHELSCWTSRPLEWIPARRGSSGQLESMFWILNSFIFSIDNQYLYVEFLVNYLISSHWLTHLQHRIAILRVFESLFDNWRLHDSYCVFCEKVDVGLEKMRYSIWVTFTHWAAVLKTWTTVAPCYNAVVGVHEMEPRYKRGAL